MCHDHTLSPRGATGWVCLNMSSADQIKVDPCLAWNPTNQNLQRIFFEDPRTFLGSIFSDSHYLVVWIGGLGN